MKLTNLMLAALVGAMPFKASDRLPTLSKQAKKKLQRPTGSKLAKKALKGTLGLTKG